MNKGQLIEMLGLRLGMDRKMAAEAVDGMFDIIVRNVDKGENVMLTGFGVFEKRARAARTARNPRTGQQLRLKRTNVPSFRAGTLFKEVVEGSRKLGRAPAPMSAAKPASAPARTPRAAAAKASRATASRPAAKSARPAAKTTRTAAAKTTAAKTTRPAAKATRTATAKTTRPAAKAAAKTTAKPAAKAARPAVKATAKASRPATKKVATVKKTAAAKKAKPAAKKRAKK
jgi:DNA-binding protein HU-beta